MCPPFGIGIISIFPLFADVNALYIAKFATTPEIGRTSA